jgi:hypothetical protein
MSTDADVACPGCGRTDIPSTELHEPHVGPGGRRCVFVRIWRRRFTEQDVVDGEITSDDCRQEIVRCLPDRWELADGLTVVDLAVAALEDAGTTETSGTCYPHEWFAHPDGSIIVDYYTGMREEPSAHLYGFTDDEAEQIGKRVGARGGGG